MEELRDELEALATQFAGEYDGWEVAVESPGQQQDALKRKVH